MLKDVLIEAGRPSGNQLSPEGLAGKGGQLGICREQHQALQFGLGCQHPIKGIAVGLAVGTSPESMGLANRQSLKAIGLQQAGQITEGASQFGASAL